MDDASRGLLNGRVVLQPMLSVRGGAQAVEFYQRAFGASEIFRISEDGVSVVARLAIGKAEFWVADESPAHENYSPESLNGSTVRMVLIVDDPDAFAARAVSAGAKVVNPVEDQPYGWRVGRVVDPFGHHWEIGKPIDDLA
jgi:PhnB protein